MNSLRERWWKRGKNKSRGSFVFLSRRQSEEKKKESSVSDARRRELGEKYTFLWWRSPNSTHTPLETLVQRGRLTESGWSKGWRRMERVSGRFLLLTDTVTDHGTVVVKDFYAVVTNSTVRRSRWPPHQTRLCICMEHSTRRTKSIEINILNNNGT